MITSFEIFSIVTIIAGTFAGGYYPLIHREKANNSYGFPLGEAFTSGVFIALSLILMLPSASNVLNRSFKDIDFPVAMFISALAFMFLLGLEHITKRIDEHNLNAGQTTSSIPLIMTFMIAVPSFFLGTALGISDTASAFIIWVAIMAHKSSAAFALALKMVRSTLSVKQTYLIFTLFALSTPAGIFTGEDLHQYLSGETMLGVKGFVLSLAAGTFLYMGTLHDLEHSAMIRNCRTRKGFIFMVAGFFLTVMVRVLIGEAHEL